jgi:subtilisin family serine protease
MPKAQIGRTHQVSSSKTNVLAPLVLVAGLFLAACKGGDGGGDIGGDSGGTGGDGFLGPSSAVGTYYGWMNAEIKSAWEQGYLGQFANVTVIDDFTSGKLYRGDLGPGRLRQQHGDWATQQITYLAPQASVNGIDFNSDARIPLSAGLNILNLSYGAFEDEGVNLRWGRQESSIIDYATRGAAVVVKAAGNDDGTAVGAANSDGQVDYLNRDLIGAQSVIFVGALSSNGSIESPASIAAYSNIAGTNPTVQGQFLVVGVEGTKTGLYGTSFAAPIVSGYAAVLGSKFTSATPTQITNQLLRTARQDTVRDYAISVHGQGEASIANALAPNSIR